jgi:chromosomal replication initiator protein
MNYQEVWQATLGELELTLSKPNFTTWFKDTYLSFFETDTATIAVPNAFTKTWFEKKYHIAIVKALAHASSGAVKTVSYIVDSRPVPAQMTTNVAADNFSASETKPAEQPATNIFGLNPKYKFSNFIVGKQNEMANAAAKAIIEHPGTVYNPLFIYGGVGLGKTHLLHAVAHALIEKNPKTRVLYVTCEKFTNDFINAVKTGATREFKDRYRNVDLLLVDDIQFIAGKKETQEEFFNTFNHLHQLNNQIILSSDRPPKAILAEERLLSRLEWGLTTDIGSPDFETRIAILQEKAKEKNFPVSEEILNIIANSITTNIRELEGALNKLIANCQLRNLTPSPELARQLISNLATSAGKKSTSPKQIVQIVAEYFDLPIPDLLGASREKRLAFPRQIAMFILREDLRVSYPAIGVEIGGRDHTTAMHAYEKINREKEENNKLKQDIEQLRAKIYSI